MVRRRVRDKAMLASLALWFGACNELTGSNQYEETERCTGPMCGVCPAGRTWDPAQEVCIEDSVWCATQGGQWDTAQQTCLPAGTCAAGRTWDPGQEVCIEDSVWCATQGGQWDTAQQTCLPAGTCPAGQRWFEGNGSCVALCAQGTSECGASCCGFGLRCVSDTSGNQSCSICESAELICGEACCEPGSTCSNVERGVCSTAYGAVGQSCAAGVTCNGEDCCEALEVPGGTFPMGSPESDGDASADEFPERDVTVSTYELGRYEVTVGRFRAFVEGWDYSPPPPGAGAHPRIAGSGWRSVWDKRLPESRGEFESLLDCGNGATWPEGNEALPINCVSWFEAFAFCAWDGGRLPTEAEWENAAAGGEENRKYPWGDAAPTYAHAVYDCSYGGTPGDCSTSDVFAPVGSKPLGGGRWGHEDLAGSMWEWVLDVYDDYDASVVCDDCANAPDAPIRVLRGGTWAYYGSYLRAANRDNNTPTFRHYDIGFRCARTP